MAEQTAIEWCDATFNPWMGCTRVSPACDDCYAARSTPARTLGVTWGAGEQRRRTSDANWKLPGQWNAKAAREGRRVRVFCASLADVFDNEVPVQWRRDLFDLIEATPHLDWLLLTKRIGNARRLYADAYLDSARPWPANVWLGATVVNQEEADRDIPKLLDVPARVRFLSIEPMLGAIDLRHLNDGRETNEIDALKPFTWEQEVEAWRGTTPEWEDDFEDWFGQKPEGLTGPMHARIDWVICGGESGPTARPMHPDWARQLRDQCASAGVPFLFKQWGEWVSVSEVAGDGPHHEFDDLARVRRIGKKAAGRTLDGVEHTEFPCALESLTMTTNKAPELVYSTDEENFSHDFCGMLDSLRTEFDDGDLVGKTYWVGEKVEHPASYYFKGAADDVVQRACDDAYQENEHAEDFTSDVTKEALAELQTFINTWADKHVGVTFWTARNVREMKVTPEDLA